MARLVPAKCPQCAAAVDLDPDEEVVRCSYCGTTSFIHRPQRQAPPNMPVVHIPVAAKPSSGGGGVVALIVVVSLVVMVGAGAVFFVAGGSTPERSAKKSEDRPAKTRKKKDPAKRKKAPKVTLMDGRPLLADANGDGIDDLILRTKRGNKTAHAAYNPKTGKLLWSTDADLGHGVRTFVGAGRLLEVSDRGQVTAYLLTDGKQQWTTSLGEKMEGFCRGDDKSLLVLTTAKEVKRLDAAAGGQTAESPEACVREMGSQGSTMRMRTVRLDPRDRRDYDAPAGVEGFLCGSVRVSGSARYVVPDRCRKEGMGYESIAGMASYRIWRDGDGFVVLGYKHPGTRIPMVARAKPRSAKPDWTQVVPTGNPLDASPGEPKAATLVGDLLVVAWSAGTTAFDKKTGKRRWTIKESSEHLLRAGPYVVVSNRNALEVLDAADGKTRHRFGK